MGKNDSGVNEEGLAPGPHGRLPEGKKAEGEAFLTGKNLGYHLGFESGYEKGYIEGSNLGHNNGFLAALKLGEGFGDLSTSANVPERNTLQVLQKIFTTGQARIFLTGCSSGEAKTLFRLLNIEATVISRVTKI